MNCGDHLAAYTVQRQTDQLAMPWSSYDGRRIALRQSKIRKLVWVPARYRLRAALIAARKEATSTLILTAPEGAQWKANHFQHMWRRVTLRDGLDGLQARDLRRTGMVRMKEAGAEKDIAAVAGRSIDSCQKILDTYIPSTEKMAPAAVRRLERADRRAEKRAANTARTKNGS